MLQVIITINNKMYMLMYHASLHKLTHFQNNLKNEIYKFFQLLINLYLYC